MYQTCDIKLFRALSDIRTGNEKKNCKSLANMPAKQSQTSALVAEVHLIYAVYIKVGVVHSIWPFFYSVRLWCI